MASWRSTFDRRALDRLGAAPAPTIVARTRSGRRPRSASPIARIAPTPPTGCRFAAPDTRAATLATPTAASPALRTPEGRRGLGGSGRALTADAIVIRVVRIDATTKVRTVINAPAAIDAAIASTDTENRIVACFSWISGTCVPADDTINQPAAIPGSAPINAAATA